MLTLKNYVEKTATSIEPSDLSHITSIEDSAFISFSNLTSISLGTNILFIGEYAFGYCTQVSSCVLNCPNASISSRGLDFTPGLTPIITSITLNVARLENQALGYQGISSLTTINVGNNCSYIGKWVFGTTTNATYYFRQPRDFVVDLSPAGENGVFYNKTAHSCTIYTDNLSIKNYNFSGDNCTATIYHLDGSPWE